MAVKTWGEGEGRSEDEITPISETEGSVIRAEGNGVWANGVGGIGAFVVLINVKGTARHTHKVNGEGSE